MFNKKTLPVIIPILAVASFIWIQSWGRNNNDGKYERILQAVSQMLEQGHYSPKPINDAFSQEVFIKVLKRLDPDKSIFLSTDSVALQKQYGNLIDDEIHGKIPVAFVPAVHKLYNQRLTDLEKVYKSILSQPFTFTQAETLVMDGDKLAFTINTNEQQNHWRKKLKYFVLERYIDLLEQRSKATAKDTTAHKTDAQLEIEARNKVIKIMDRTFLRLHKETEENQFNAFVDDITTSMDPHTNFFPPVEKRAFDEQMSGRFYGIGAQLKEEEGNIKITSVITGTPAWKSGQISINDVITKVAQSDSNAVDITGYAVQEAVKLIRGQKGTTVVLTIKKVDGSTKTVRLVRDEIVQDETFARSVIVAGKYKVGYIYLPEFYADFDRTNGARCSDDVAKEIKKLKKENVQTIVMDLRNNGGGSLVDVVKMVGYFIPSGPVVQVKDRAGRPNSFMDEDTSVLWAGPLAVMVNEFSASASEIFAAAIQDYNRGIIIGSSSTYGKGTVQRSISLDNNSFFSNDTEIGNLKLTLQKFYRINGGSTQLKGVTPDIILPDNFEYLKLREKDDPDALPWDVMSKATYKPWNNGTYLKQIAALYQQKITAHPIFAAIQKNAAWLAKENDKVYSLQLSTYQAEQKKIKTVVSQLDSMVKINKPLQINSLPQDVAKYNSVDKEKSERYKQWLKSLKTDIYLSQTVDIISDIFQQGNWARN